jgi:Tol biopolymer transport system component
MCIPKGVLSGAALAGALLVCGCGGGGGSATAGGGGGGQNLNLGLISAMSSSSPATPLVQNSGSCSFFGISGASFSAVSYQPGQVLANTRIAYRDATGNLSTCDPSGNNQIQLTSDLVPNSDVFISWRSDASQILYLGNSGGNLHFFLVGPTGFGERVVNTGANLLNRGKLSPDGTKILYSIFNASSGVDELRTIPITGGGVHPCEQSVDRLD